MKLLIIDDSENIRKALKKSINLIPKITRVFEAEDVDDGYQFIKENNPDIIILDLMLKSGTGLDVLKKMGDDVKTKLILVYSSYTTPRFRSLIKKYGVYNYFDKQTEIIEIIDFIQSRIGE